MSFQLVKSVLLRVRPTVSNLEILRNSLSTTAARTSSSAPVNENATGSTQLSALADSLASKGYLRAQKPYTPPADVRPRIATLVAELKLAAASKNLSAQDKFAVLNACFESFEHSVPNSHLHEVNSVDEIIRFYETPVNTTLPLDAMRTMELPANLHIQHEYVRFTGDKTDRFGGQTAFPRSSTLVTGLKYRNKYQGHTAKRSWP